MSELRHKCTVRYQIATYSGTEIVYCGSNDDNDVVENKARLQLVRKCGPLPLGVQSFKIIDREEIF